MNVIFFSFNEKHGLHLSDQLLEYDINFLLLHFHGHLILLMKSNLPARSALGLKAIAGASAEVWLKLQ